MVWDARAWLQRQRLPCAAGVGVPTAIAISPDGRFLMVGGDGCHAQVWDARRWEVLAVLVGHTAAVTACAFTDDAGAGWCVTCAADGGVCVWDVRTWALVHELPGRSGAASDGADCCAVLRVGGTAPPLVDPEPEVRTADLLGM